MIYFIKKYFKTFINIIFPEICLHCNSTINGEIICDNCASKLKFREGNFCPKCATSLSKKICPVCEKEHFYFDEAKAVYDFIPELRSLIHNLKYTEIKRIGKFLANLAYLYIKKNPFSQKIDLITPVPLHSTKYRIRGYNQTEIIVSNLSKIINIKYIPNLIKRTKFTKTQTKLTRIERKKNVSHAFFLNRKFSVENKNILIVDDVFTTGSTMNAISKLLKESKVKNVFILTIGKA